MCRPTTTPHVVHVMTLKKINILEYALGGREGKEAGRQGGRGGVTGIHTLI